MDNQDYLDQITASAQPTKPRSGITNIIPPLALKLLIGGVILAILIIVFGIIFGNMGTKTEDLAKQLSIRLNNVSETIDKYNPAIKSSQLRQYGSETKATINNTQRDLNQFLEKKYGYKKPDTKSKMFTDETDYIEKTNKELEYARLNAFLDRVYVQQLMYQIEQITALESNINARTDNQELKDIVNSSATNLQNAHGSLEKVSETIK